MTLVSREAAREFGKWCIGSRSGEVLMSNAQYEKMATARASSDPPPRGLRSLAALLRINEDRISVLGGEIYGLIRNAAELTSSGEPKGKPYMDYEDWGGDWWASDGETDLRADRRVGFRLVVRTEIDQ